VNGWDWRYGLRLIVGGIFIVAALPKIADPAGFARDIHNYRLLPFALENVFALTLPWIELLAGLGLVLNIAPRGSSLIIGGLLVVFLVAIAQAVVRNLDIDCGCFGTNDASKTGWLALLRDAVFLVLALLGWPRTRVAMGRVRTETA
jgi:uncharacterized membrane protein YphA (DoxX/SURF4 family)